MRRLALALLAGSMGDVDGDSDTDQADLGLLLANFGAACR